MVLKCGCKNLVRPPTRLPIVLTAGRKCMRCSRPSPLVSTRLVPRCPENLVTIVGSVLTKLTLVFGKATPDAEVKVIMWLLAFVV